MGACWIVASTAALAALVTTAGMSLTKGPSMDRAEMRGLGIGGVAGVPDRYPYEDRLGFDYLVGLNRPVEARESHGRH
jgi:hypothetical protein